MTVIQEKGIKEALAGEPQAYSGAEERTNAGGAARIKYLRIALQIVGVVFIFGIYTLSIVWPSGWVWHTGHTSHYLQMILGVYATLGVFLLIASRKPLAHLSLIWFTVWSSVVHAAIMAVQAKLDIFWATSRHCLLSPPSLRFSPREAWQQPSLGTSKY